MADMLVNLLNLPNFDVDEAAKNAGIKIFKPLAPDKHHLCEFVKELSGISAACEFEICFSRLPVTSFVATADSKPIGYACYDAIAKDFFGPTAVLEEYRGRGIGKILLFKTLYEMRESGYVYAIIGGIGPAEFYEKTVNAKIIDKDDKGIYNNFLNLGKKP